MVDIQLLCEGLRPHGEGLDPFWGLDTTKRFPELWKHAHQCQHHDVEARIELASRIIAANATVENFFR